MIRYEYYSALVRLGVLPRPYPRPDPCEDVKARGFRRIDDSAQNREGRAKQRQKAGGAKAEGRRQKAESFCLLPFAYLPSNFFYFLTKSGAIELFVDAIVVHYLLHVRLGFVETDF